MSEVQKYKMLADGKSRKVKIQIEQDFFPVDNTELIKERVEKITTNEINPIDDWEKSKYSLICDEGNNITNTTNCYKFDLQFFNNCDNSVDLYCIASHTTDWTEAGIFNQNDVTYKSARFVGSYVRFSYFTTPHRETQKLISYANIQLEQNNDATITICPDQPGSFIYHWKSEEKLNVTNSRLYLKVEFFNSATGQVYTVSPIIPNEWSTQGEFFIDYWNEKMDYVPLLLDPATRTYRFSRSRILHRRPGISDGKL